MIEDFLHQIETELGPLNPDWFEELTAKAAKDGLCSVAVEEEEEVSSDKDDGMFKAPVETPASDDRKSSTPRIFRNRRPQSPNSVLAQSPGSGMQTPLSVLPWTDSSPCLFGSAQDSQRFEKDHVSLKKNDYFGFLDTPPSLVQNASAKRISESLGAQLNPDLSWSSSFNTPSALSPTVILTKKEAQLSPVSVLRDKEVIIVRKLFPSLSKGTESTCGSTSTAQHNATLINVNVQECGQASDESFDNMNALWRQKVPDAIKDGDVRNTVESVLDGADDVLSIFFSNSSSALRRVKTKERMKKKVNSVAKETERSTDQSLASKVDQEMGPFDNSATLESPLKNKDFSQWTPLSLSDVSGLKAKQGCTSEFAQIDGGVASVNRNKEEHVSQPSQFSSCTVEKARWCPDSYPEKSQLRSSLLAASPTLTFSRKTRKFVYRVQSPYLSSKGQTQNATPDKLLHPVIEILTDKHYGVTSLADGSKHIEGDVYTEDTGGSVEDRGETAVKKEVKSAGLNMDHGLDMTQLCKAFAEDFTQEVNVEKSPSKRYGHSEHAMRAKMSKVQTRTESENQYAKETINLLHLPTTETSGSPKHNQDCPGILSDFIKPHSSGTEGHYAGFKTANNTIILVPPEAIMKAKAKLDDLEEQQLSLHGAKPDKASENPVLSSPVVAKSPERYVHGLKPGGKTSDLISDASSVVGAEPIPDSFIVPSNESGFRTASNRTITVSPINLEKAKDVFKQLQEEKSALYSPNADELEVQHVKNARLPKFDFKSNHSDHNKVEGNCFLTASQKADVTELCSMLEEGDSQYEFTQFRQARLGSKLPDSRDWDPDILSGIDFDDSFNCDVERQVSTKHHAKPDTPNQHTPVPNSVHEDVFIQSINISKACHVPQETPNANLSLTDDGLTLRSDGKEMAKAFKVETNTREENKSFCVGFKTARGNSVCVSEEYLSKARSLFADLEDSEGNFGPKYNRRKVTVEQNQKSDDHHAAENSRVACRDGLLYCKEKVELEPRSEENLRHGNTSWVATEAETFKPTCIAASLDSAQGEKDERPDLLKNKIVNFGFSTAGGKDLKVSEKSLQNAKKLLNGGLNHEEASKCEAALSLKAPPKTKAANPSRTSLHDRSDLLVDLHRSKMSDSLTKDSKDENSEEVTEMIQNVSQCHASKSEQSGGFKMASGKEVTLTARAIENSKTFFKDIEGADVPDKTKSNGEDSELDLEVERSHNTFVNGFKMASGKGVNFSEKASIKSKTMLKDCDLDCSDNPQASEDTQSVINSCECKAVAGNAVHLPEKDSLKEEPTVLNKYAQREFTKTSAEVLQSASGCGFSTASGKAVFVSAEAVQRAKAVFDESSDVSPCETTVEISEDKSNPETEAVVEGHNWGFSTASGNKVAISDEALEKAKSRLLRYETESVASESLLTSAKDPVLPRGFSPASSEETKTEFPACDDISSDVHEVESCLPLQKEQQKSSFNKALSSLSKSVPSITGKPEGKSEILKAENSKRDQLKVGNFGFNTASGKGVSVSKSALRAAFEMFRDCDIQEDRHQVKTESLKSIEKRPPVVPESVGIGQSKDTASSFTSQSVQADSSLLNRHSLNINGCTVTQQKYFEQEAMACTKALLEDDFDCALSETMEDSGIHKCSAEPHQRSLDTKTGERKRLSDDDLTGHPPLKRRLVSEFNQVSDGKRICAPVKSSPNGTLSDRKVFKYNLKPYVTHPSRNAMNQKMLKSDLKTVSRGQKSGPIDPKAVMFVPPFRKNIEPELRENIGPREEVKVSSTFIPPFKKDITVSQSRSSLLDSTDSSSVPVCENKKTLPEVKPHTAEGHDREEIKSKREVVTGVKLEDGAAVTCEAKVTETWQQSLGFARDVQSMRIRKKKRQNIRPLPGSFLLAKTSGVTRVSLREAVGYKCPLQHTPKELYRHGVHCNVSQVTAENAETFRFHCDDFFKREVFIENAGVQLADGGWLIPDNKGTMGKEEFCRALCDTPGVDPRLISEAWVFNHYRWIVWKQACMERAFPEGMGSRCLTPEQVLFQLKFRYDVEVDHSRRSALKRILERDDAAARTLVLCVCGIADHSDVEAKEAVVTTEAKSESPPAIIWLTDGWYSIKALLDPPLSAMFQKGRLRVGGKVMIHGAELIGSQDACSPLEAPDCLMLKISANSTRRVRWDTKLGFYKDPRPFKLSLSSLFPNGGVVGCVDMIVLRSYPTQWMEKKSGGVFVFRNERAEDREARLHSSAKQKTMELLLSKIEAQFEKEEEEKKKVRTRQRFHRYQIEELQDGEELYSAMESDPAYAETHLSAGQMEAVNSYRRSVAERRQAELQERIHRALKEAEGGCPNRDVTPVWKLAISDFMGQNSNRVYTLNIWRPSAELRSLLREGCRYKAYHLATSESKKRFGTASIQFTTTKKTQFQDMAVCPVWLRTRFPARRLSSFRDVQNPGFSSPCGEVDIVGFVISIVDRQGPSPVLYMVDDKFDFVSVKSFSSLVQQALDDLVKPLALLAISNLQLQEVSGPVPRLYAGEHALFTMNPKEVQMQEAVAHLTTFVQYYEHFFRMAEEKLSNLIPTGNLKSGQSPRTPGLQSLPKPNSRIHGTPQLSRVFSPFTPVSRRISAPPVQTPEMKDPKSLKRKRGIDYLSRVPSPPPLSPLSIVTPPSVKKTFNPPRRSRTPQAVRTGPPNRSRQSASSAVEEQWVNDDELAMINTQTLLE